MAASGFAQMTRDQLKQSVTKAAEMLSSDKAEDVVTSVHSLRSMLSIGLIHGSCWNTRLSFHRILPKIHHHLAFLAFSPQCRHSLEANHPPVREVVDSGAVPFLVDFLSSDDYDLVFQSLWALTNIASDDDTCDYLVSVGIIPPLKACLE